MSGQFFHFLRKEEGSGLVLALLTLMVLSVLGASAGAVTLGSYRLSDVNRDDTSAYYIAEAGANMAFEEFQKEVLAEYEEHTTQGTFFDNVSSVSTKLSGKSYDTFQPQQGNTPEAVVEIVADGDEANPRKYTIQSTGTVDGKSRTVKKPVEVKWVEKSRNGEVPSIPEGVVLKLKNDFTIASGTIQGDFYLDSVVHKPITISNAGDNYLNVSKLLINNRDSKDIFKGAGEDYIDSLKSKLVPVSNESDWSNYQDHFDEVKRESGSFPILEKDFNQNGEVFLDTDYRLTDMIIRGNHRIIISDKDIDLFVDTLKNSWGTTTVEGQGTLTIYVKNRIEFTGGSRFNFDNEYSNVRIVHMNQTEEPVSVNGNSRVRASVVAPFSNVDITGSAQLHGDLTAGSLNISGTGKLIHSPFEFNDPPEDISEIPEEEIISSEPAVEAQ